MKPWGLVTPPVKPSTAVAAAALALGFWPVVTTAAASSPAIASAAVATVSAELRTDWSLAIEFNFVFPFRISMGECVKKIPECLPCTQG